MVVFISGGLQERMTALSAEMGGLLAAVEEAEVLPWL